MRPDRIVFALVLILGGLLSVALLLPEPPGGHGALHEDYPSMLQGGSGAERHGPILWLGWSIGTAQILLLISLVALGGRRGGRLREGFGTWLLFTAAVYVAVWTAIVLAYQRYLTDPDPAFYLALPAPTALMIYVLWPTPLLLTALFVLGFRRFVLSEDDQEAFAKIVARRQAQQWNEAND